jgi:hypothetical protein
MHDLHDAEVCNGEPEREEARAMAEFAVGLLGVLALVSVLCHFLP